MRIVLLGAPGSGKGTQSQRLVARLRIPQISTGDLLRAAVSSGTELGRKAKAAMDAGRLVDDALVLGMLRERLAEPDTRSGFILDGFPRNLAQARSLDALLAELGQPLDAVVQLDIDYGELASRISGRRCCQDCGRVFNMLTSPPPAGELCPRTGAPHRLVQRPDDNEATVTERLRVYDEKTRPLIDFYRARGLLRVIDAQGDVAAVTERLAQALAVAGGTAASAHRTRAPAPRVRARTAARKPRRKASARPRAKRAIRAGRRKAAVPAARKAPRRAVAGARRARAVRRRAAKSRRGRR